MQFLPIDRVNTILAVAPNPGVFAEVEKWLVKLDITPKVTAGSIENNVYRLKYGRAEILGGVISQLYGGCAPGGGFGGEGPMDCRGIPAILRPVMQVAAVCGQFGGAGQFGGGGGGAYGSPYGGGVAELTGRPTAARQGAYGSPYGGGGYGGAGTAAPEADTGWLQPMAQRRPHRLVRIRRRLPRTAARTRDWRGSNTGCLRDQTGSYLEAGAAVRLAGQVRIIPNHFDNTLIVQSTPEQWEQVKDLLDQLDISPRQVLIDAKIYEVDLSGSFSAGVESFLQQRNAANPTGIPRGSCSVPTARRERILSAGTLVGQSRQLLALLNLEETKTSANVLSAPSIIATDSIPASITVGDSVPTLVRRQ